jgi:uncharacterized membrane protein
MDFKKFLIGSLVGGIAYFLLGYLFYGLLLNSFFSQHSIAPSGSMKAMADIIWWVLVLGNLFMGALLTYIFLKVGSVKSFGSGAGTGAAVGFFLWLSIDLINFSTQNSFTHKSLLADVVVGIVMTAIAGGIIGAVLGMGKAKS